MGALTMIEYVESFIEHTKSIMTMLNARDISELKQSKFVFDHVNVIEQRG